MKTFITVIFAIISISFSTVFAQTNAGTNNEPEKQSVSVKASVSNTKIHKFTYASYTGKMQRVEMIVSDGEVVYKFIDANQIYFYLGEGDERELKIQDGNTVTETFIKKIMKEKDVSTISFDVVNNRGMFVFGHNQEVPF